VLVREREREPMANTPATIETITVIMLVDEQGGGGNEPGQRAEVVLAHDVAPPPDGYARTVCR